jgi:hypothetical protein
MKKLTKITSLKRLQQIEKIVRYAKNFLDVEVEFVCTSTIGGDSGHYLAPKGQRRGKVVMGNDFSGLMTILILLHELGHHIDFLKRGYVELEEIAYNYYPEDDNQKCPIKYRKHIRNVENMANFHAWEIATYLDLKIPKFSFLKDVLFQQESLNYTLANGPCSKKMRDKLWRKCHKKARELAKCKSTNPMLLISVIKS